MTGQKDSAVTESAVTESAVTESGAKAGRLMNKNGPCNFGRFLKIKCCALSADGRHCNIAGFKLLGAKQQ